MRAIIDYILKNKEWIFSGIGVLIISGLLLLIRYTFRRLPSRSYFVKRNENRKIFVGGILREIKEERQHFERIKKGKHLNLTGTTRPAVLKYSFDDIKGMVRRLEDERQYKKLVIPILQLINDRDMDNPV